MGQDPQNQLNSSSDSDVNDAMELLHQDDEDEVIEKPEKEKKEEKEEEEEVEEIKLVAEKEEEKEEEEPEIEVPFRRQEVLKKYPNIYKEFPFLERANYKAQQYTELFGTVEDAKEIAEKAQEFDKYQQDISTGNMEGVIRSVRENDPDAYAKLVDNYMPNLARVDPQAYYSVIGNIMRNAVISMRTEADKIENERLKDAALILNQFIFGTSDVPEPSSLSKQSQPSDQELRLKQQQEQFLKQRYETTYEDLSGRVNNVLKSTISQHIDPREVMTEYVKKNAVKDALTMTQEAIGNDPGFRKILDGLWRKAFDSNFDRDSVGKIRSAYLSKAKTVLPVMIKKARTEALKGASRNREIEGRPPINRGRSTSSNESSGKKTEIPAGMSSLDFLLKDD